MLSRINRHPDRDEGQAKLQDPHELQGLNKEAWTRASPDLSEELLS